MTENTEFKIGTTTVKKGLAQMLKGGVMVSHYASNIVALNDSSPPRFDCCSFANRWIFSLVPELVLY
jgi:hypothetical protein